MTTFIPLRTLEETYDIQSNFEYGQKNFLEKAGRQ